MTQHAQAPWQKRRNLIQAADGSDIALVMTREDQTVDLLTLAPELLRALKNCCYSMEWHKNQGRLAGMDYRYVEEAKALLAKVENHQAGGRQ